MMAGKLRHWTPVDTAPAASGDVSFAGPRRFGHPEFALGRSSTDDRRFAPSPQGNGKGYWSTRLPDLSDRCPRRAPYREARAHHPGVLEQVLRERGEPEREEPSGLDSTGSGSNQGWDSEPVSNAEQAEHPGLAGRRKAGAGKWGAAPLAVSQQAVSQQVVSSQPVKSQSREWAPVAWRCRRQPAGTGPQANNRRKSIDRWLCRHRPQGIGNHLDGRLRLADRCRIRNRFPSRPPSGSRSTGSQSTARSPKPSVRRPVVPRPQAR